MNIIAKIAFRNVLKNKKRSILIGFAIFISSVILLVSNAGVNGVISQVSKAYINIQSGHVGVMWEDQYNISSIDTSKFINPKETYSYDIDKDAENKEVIKRLNVFLDENSDKIKAFYPTVRRNAEYSIKDIRDTIIIYGISSDESKFLLDTNTIGIEKGKMLPDTNDGVCISEEKAEKADLEIGDKIEVTAITQDGTKNTMEFEIKGIYSNGAEYNNWYGFVSKDAARELFKMDSDYFDVGRIYLESKENAQEFAERLDEYLVAESPVLRAASYIDASMFYSTMPKILKNMYTVFIFFLLSIIAVGLHSVVRMSLFERMKEFGTIRSIGYTRKQSFAMIFFEVFILATIAFSIALVLVGTASAILSQTGIYIGSGSITNALGGEYLYPRLKVLDVVLGILIIVVFSLMSTVTPGLKLCYQKIPNIMAKRQEKISLLKCLFRSIFPKKVNN